MTRNNAPVRGTLRDQLQRLADARFATTKAPSDTPLGRAAKKKIDALTPAERRVFDLRFDEPVPDVHVETAKMTFNPAPEAKEQRRYERAQREAVAEELARPHQPMAFFACGGKKKHDDCSTTGCTGLAVDTCVAPLRGRATGRVCGRKLCTRCAGAKKLCPPHVRVVG